MQTFYKYQAKSKDKKSFSFNETMLTLTMISNDKVNGCLGLDLFFESKNITDTREYMYLTKSSTSRIIQHQVIIGLVWFLCF